jgi:hypothetical protein
MSGSDLLLAYVGAMPLDEDRAPDNPGFSPAGELLQQRIIGALGDAGAQIDRCFLLRAVTAFPRTKHLVIRRRRSTVVGAPARLLPFLNLPVVKVASAALSFLAALTWWGIARRRDSRRAIVVFNVANPAGAAIVLAGWVTGTPVFAIVADVPVPGSGLVPRNLLRSLDFALQTRTLQRFDGLIVLTERIATDFAPRVPFILMEGAVPDARTSEPPVCRCDDENFVLMYSGGLSEFKGTPLLLEAFAAVRDPRCRLWIAGAGDAQHLVEAAAARDPRITYWGLLPNEQVLELYRRTDVLVNPHSATALSARYVFPSKLLEYLAAGRPVISTVSTPEVEEIYGSYIHAVPGNDAASLASVIQQVAALPAAVRENRAREGRRFVLDHKSWSIQGRRMAEFIAERLSTR